MGRGKCYTDRVLDASAHSQSRFRLVARRDEKGRVDKLEHEHLAIDEDIGWGSESVQPISSASNYPNIKQ
jgi:hypothetical protein